MRFAPLARSPFAAASDRTGSDRSETPVAHLFACPACGAANALNARDCWQCEALLTAPKRRAVPTLAAVDAPPRAATVLAIKNRPAPTIGNAESPVAAQGAVPATGDAAVPLAADDAVPPTGNARALFAANGAAPATGDASVGVAADGAATGEDLRAAGDGVRAASNGYVPAAVAAIRAHSAAVGATQADPATMSTGQAAGDARQADADLLLPTRQQAFVATNRAAADSRRLQRRRVVRLALGVGVLVLASGAAELYRLQQNRRELQSLFAPDHLAPRAASPAALHAPLGTVDATPAHATLNAPTPAATAGTVVAPTPGTAPATVATPSPLTTPATPSRGAAPAMVARPSAVATPAVADAPVPKAGPALAAAPTPSAQALPSPRPEAAPRIAPAVPPADPATPSLAERRAAIGLGPAPKANAADSARSAGVRGTTGRSAAIRLQRVGQCARALQSATDDQGEPTMTERVRQGILGAMLAFGLLLPLAVAAATVDYKIVTASERGTYIQIGRDLAKFVAPAADIELEVLPSAGSAENVQRLRYEPGVKFALVQSDVYQAFLDQAAAGNAEAGEMIRPLRVIMPLYNEEIYFIARADSPLELRARDQGRPINVGPLRSGTAMSATTIYRQMFGHPIADANASFLSQRGRAPQAGRRQERRRRRRRRRSAGQAAGRHEARGAQAHQAAEVRSAQQPAQRRGAEDLFPGDDPRRQLSESADGRHPGRGRQGLPRHLRLHARRLGRATWRGSPRSLCQNFAKLQAEGHPKWREVQLALPTLGRGWAYYPPMERQLRSCIAKNAATAAAVRNKANCTQQERVLGLCE